jgi:hypothetical protein
LHIDHFRKKSRRVWAVQYMEKGPDGWRPVYRVIKGFELLAPARDRFHEGKNQLQPVAYVHIEQAQVMDLPGERVRILPDPRRHPR